VGTNLGLVLNLEAGTGSEEINSKYRHKQHKHQAFWNPGKVANQTDAAHDSSRSMDNHHGLTGIKTHVQQTVVEMVASRVKRRTALHRTADHQRHGINQRNRKEPQSTYRGNKGIGTLGR